MTRADMYRFMKEWRVEMRSASAYFPQSNGTAEAAVKSAKRLLRANTGPGGILDTNSVNGLAAILTLPLGG